VRGKIPRHAYDEQIRTTLEAAIVYQQTNVPLTFLLACAACGSSSTVAEGLHNRPARAEFTTTDGVQIVGDYYPPTGRGVVPAAVLLHMYKSDRSSWKPLVRPLHDAGFAVLAIDMRGHGESTQPESKNLAERVNSRDDALFNAMYKDVEAALAWVRKQPNVDPDRYVLCGASVGCSVALHHTALHDDALAVICLSPGTNYLGVESTEHIRAIRKTPVLLLATEGERRAVDQLAEIGKTAEGDILGPGRTHGTRMFGKIEDIESRIADAFAKIAYTPADEGE